MCCGVLMRVVCMILNIVGVVMICLNVICVSRFIMCVGVRKWGLWCLC